MINYFIKINTKSKLDTEFKNLDLLTIESDSKCIGFFEEIEEFRQ